LYTKKVGLSIQINLFPFSSKTTSAFLDFIILHFPFKESFLYIQNDWAKYKPKANQIERLGIMKRLGKTLLILIIVISALSSFVVIGGAAYLRRYKNAHVDPSLIEIAHRCEKTKFYCYDFSDRDGRVGEAVLIESSELGGEVTYKYVPYNEIPENLVNAFIAIEDKRFYKHNGVDFIRTAKAAFNYVFGSGKFGGSTITQQLVKNLTGNDDFSIDRKLSEAFCAIDLEKEYDKTEILEMYLNVINLSEGCRGVGAAAEYFYSKKPSELTLSECATIAAITNNPSKYNPKKHPENNRERRNLILKCMLEMGYITEDEFIQAVAEPIALNPSRTASEGGVNTWYVDMVIEDVLRDLCKKYNISRSAASLMLYHGGLKIYTAMDLEIQTILDEYYSDIYNFPIDNSGQMAQSSMIVIDPYNGDILGVAGAIGEKPGNRVQNYATDTKRPPGSAIKPLSVYSIALEKGLIEWSSIFEDSPVKPGSETQAPWPLNADKTYAGNVDIQYAVANSLNTVAVKVLEMVGNEESLSFLKNDLLIDSLDNSADIGSASLALGQSSRGISLRELVAAYSIFQEGIMSKPRSYFKITDENGQIILDNPSEQESVLSRETAAIMTKLLESVVDTGTAKDRISLDKITDVAGKTGTTQNNCDRYFVGYTPELLAGVWFGYEYPKALDDFGGNPSLYLWDEIMSKIYEKTDYGAITRFSVPETVQKLTYETPLGEILQNVENVSDVKHGWFSFKENNYE